GRVGVREWAGDVEEGAVLEAGGTRGLAGAAGEAAIEVQPRPVGHWLALQRLLHEVDAPARAVVLVAEQQVGRAGRGAEAAVHALPQDRVGLVPLGRVLDEICQSRLV